MSEAAQNVKREGVVNLWRSARTMQIWQEKTLYNYLMREIGENLSLRCKMGQEEAITHFDAPRSWWDEMVKKGGWVNCQSFGIPAASLRVLLSLLDADRAPLVARASRDAARTQALMEKEKSEQGEQLAVDFGGVVN